MPLNATTLAGAVVDAVEGANLPDPPATGSDGKLTRAARIEAWTPVAEAIVDHIKNNGVVTGLCPNGGGPLTRGRVT